MPLIEQNIPKLQVLHNSTSVCVRRNGLSSNTRNICWSSGTPQPKTDRVAGTRCIISFENFPAKTNLVVASTATAATTTFHKYLARPIQYWSLEGVSAKILFESRATLACPQNVCPSFHYLCSIFPIWKGDAIFKIYLPGSISSVAATAAISHYALTNR